MGFLKAVKRSFVGEPVSCEYCGVPTRDAITGVPVARESTSLCRAHLLEEFRTALIAFDYCVVLLDWDFVQRAEAGYDFFPIADMVKEFSFPDQARVAIEALLSDSMGKTCGECDKPASANFVPLEKIRFDRHGPRIEDLTSQDGKPLCKEHAFSRIEPRLLAKPNSFSEECTCVPYGGPGFYIGMSV